MHSVTNITIPDSVTSIGRLVFYKCSRLKSITYKGTIAEWKKIVKGNEWNSDMPVDCIIHCTDGDIKISE